MLGGIFYHNSLWHRILTNLLFIRTKSPICANFAIHKIRPGATNSTIDTWKTSFGLSASVLSTSTNHSANSKILSPTHRTDSRNVSTEGPSIPARISISDSTPGAVCAAVSRAHRPVLFYSIKISFCVMLINAYFKSHVFFSIFAPRVISKKIIHQCRKLPKLRSDDF